MTARKIANQRSEEAVLELLRLSSAAAQPTAGVRLRYFASVLTEEFLLKSSTLAIRETLLLMDFAWRVGRDPSRGESARLPTDDEESVRLPRASA